MRLRKTAGVPAAAPGGYTWETIDDVVEVPDELGLDLLNIPGAAFAEVPAPAGKPESVTGTGEPSSPQVDAEVVEAPTTPKRGRPRKATQAEINE